MCSECAVVNLRLTLVSLKVFFSGLHFIKFARGADADSEKQRAQGQHRTERNTGLSNVFLGEEARLEIEGLS
jgi:hypothetical protein